MKLAIIPVEHYDALSNISTLENFWNTFYSLPNLIKSEWVKAIMKSNAPQSHKQGYASEIQVSMDDGYIEVFATKQKDSFASKVEDGVPAYDMKPGLLGGKRARRSKDGYAYTIVPFRHSTMELKAAGIYNDVLNLDKDFDAQSGQPTRNITKRYRITGKYFDYNAAGKIVLRNIYSKGAARFLANGMRGYRNNKLWPKGEKSTSKYAGIVKAGSGGHSSYVSFRIVSEKTTPSFKWIHPGFKSHKIFDRIKGTLEGKIMRQLQDALFRDLEEANA